MTTGSGLAAWISALPRGRRCLLSFVFGALAALGQAPYDQPLVMMAALVAGCLVFAAARTPRRAAWAGFWFGTGHFALALSWIVEPFLVDIARHGWMAPFALLFLSSGLALFWAAAFWAARLLSSAPWVLIVTWTLAELARAYVLTGFPWAMPAYGLVNATIAQGAAWVGPHGLNFGIFAFAVILSHGLLTGHRTLTAAAMALIVTACITRLALFNPVTANGPTVRLIQPNAAQHEKWDPEMIPVFFRRQIMFSSQDPRPDLIVWPETAVPTLLHQADDLMATISDAAGGVPVVLGVQRTQGLSFFNSLVVLDQNGTVSQVYDKHHLVPFGEYIPFGEMAAKIGLHGLAASQGGGFSAGPGPELLDVPGIGRALALICYEAVFPQDVNASPDRPDVLLQITNDAWFGTFSGPYQHLAQARMRAIEQGVPMIRAANTGVSAMIDAKGRISAQIELGQSGYIDAKLPPKTTATLYSKAGDLPILLLCIIPFGLALHRKYVVARNK